MRWSGQEISNEAGDPAALPGLDRLHNLVRSVRTPEFAGITFHEVLAKSALNRVPEAAGLPFNWTVNPYRGCSHGCGRLGWRAALFQWEKTGAIFLPAALHPDAPFIPRGG